MIRYKILELLHQLINYTVNVNIMNDRIQPSQQAHQRFHRKAESAFKEHDNAEAIIEMYYFNNKRFEVA